MGEGRRFGGWMAAMGLVLAIGPASACNEVVSWYADLKGGSLTPAVTTTATGRATFVFDFQNPQATIEVDTQGLQDVQRIELHACRTYADMSGPAIAVLYDAKDGPLPSTLSKTIVDADVIKTDKPSVASIQDVANVVLNSQAAVVVYTKEHPDGEIAGKIGMHKTLVYSDDPNSKFHDPHLHQAHLGVPQPPAPAAPSAPAPAVDPNGSAK